MGKAKSAALHDKYFTAVAIAQSMRAIPPAAPEISSTINTVIERLTQVSQNPR
jgi:hypothetical protein